MDYPKSVPSVGLVNGKFINEDVMGGSPGSLIPAAWGNGVTDEILNVIQSAGLQPSETDVTQLLRAIQKTSQAGEDKYALDTGGANFYMANYTPAITTLKDGLALRFTARNGNTGASTFAPNGLLAKPLISLSQSALRAAEIADGSACSVMYSAALDSWLLIYASGGTANSGKLLSVRTMTSSGVYVPTVGMKKVWVKVLGGGGGSAGIGATNSTQYSLAGGGASGSYAEAWLSASTIGASQVVTVGVGGAAGAIIANASGGGTSSMGSLVSAPGGGGSPWVGFIPGNGMGLCTGGYPSESSTGGNIVNSAGAAGAPGISINGWTLAGHGGNSPLGSGGYATSAGGAIAVPGTGYGSGAGGIANGPGAAGRPGAAGAPGVVIIYEYA